MSLIPSKAKLSPPVTQVALADSVQLDSFGRLRVSTPTTLFDSQQEYGLDTVATWDAAVYNGSATLAAASTDGFVTDTANAVGPRNANSRMTPVTVSAQDGDYAILQSRQYLRYIPGKGHLIFITGIFASTEDAIVKIVLRTNTTGTPSDSYSAYQSDWNVDTFDYVPNRFSGSNPSKLKLDFTKTQILVIQAQWLGVGRVVVGFDVDGVIYPAHIFYNANRLVLPYTQSFNLPVRMEARNVGGNIVSRTGYFDASNGVFLETTSTAEGGTVNFVCCSVQSEGGVAVRGFAKTTSNGTVTTAVTTRRPILSIRNAATYNSLVNRAHIELAELNMIASSNSAFWEIVYGGTLTGGTWPAVGSNSIAEVNLGATAISGGVVIASGFVPAGAGSARLTSSASPDIRAPLVISKIDGLAITQPAISVVCTSLSGTSNVSAALNWYEQTI